jgi:putative hydrolase of HD superfamily
LIDILDEREWIHYDRWLFLRKVLFSGFFTFAYSDINSEVKERIAEKDPWIYAVLESNVWNEMLGFDLLESVKTDIELVKKKSKEDDIIAFAKIWASYYEIYNNSLVYPDAYARILKNLVKKSERPEFSLFLKYLDFDPHNQTDIERYILVIHRLASSFRWNRSERRYPVSVLSHTYIITFFAYILGHESVKSSADITDMMMTALFHDIPEAITWDIITPTKKSVPGLEKIIEWVEYDMVCEHLLSFIDEYGFHDRYAQKMLQPWSEANGAIVKQADTFSAYYEALLEAPHSEEFQKVVEALKTKITIH